MKKSLKAALIALTMTVVLALNVQGQTTTQPQPPTSTTGPTQVSPTPVTAVQMPLPMLMSRQKMRTYAEEQSKYALSIFSSPLPVGDEAYDYVPVLEGSEAGIHAALTGISMSLDVANPEDWIYLQVNTYNEHGQPLLIADKQFKLVVMDPSGRHAMPSDYADITLDMVDDPPIDIPGALYAFVDELDANGQTMREDSLMVDEWGGVHFPWRLTETNAILAVFMNDGEWVYWNVKTGVPIVVQKFTVTVNPGVKNVISFTDCDVLQEVTTHGGNGENVTAELKITQTGKTSTVSFWTTEGKWFKSVDVRKLGESSWMTYMPTVRTLGSVSVQLQSLGAGTYYIVPNWNYGDLVEPDDPYVPPVYTGGRG